MTRPLRILAGLVASAIKQGDQDLLALLRYYRACERIAIAVDRSAPGSPEPTPALLAELRAARGDILSPPPASGAPAEWLM